MAISPGSAATRMLNSAQIPASHGGMASPVLLFWAILVLGTMCPPLFNLQEEAAASPRVELALVDGTIVHGTLHSFADGVYTISSDTLGTMRIEAAKVKEIRSGNAAETRPDTLQSLQKKMEGDAAVMDLVKSLQQDPDFQAILSDKEILHAITTGDLSSLENNLKIQKLLHKPAVREIEEKLGKPQ